MPEPPKTNRRAFLGWRIVALAIVTGALTGPGQTIGVSVFVDPFSAQYLEGVEIDYVSSMMGQGFTFRNPNASGGCGCGSSFTV